MTVLQIECEVVSAEDALRYFEPDKVRVEVVCANCDRTFTATGARSPGYIFCAPLCRETAKHVRWARRHYFGGTIDHPDIAEALRTRIAFVLSGGYPEQARRVPPAVREQVLTRSGGKCQRCHRRFETGPDAGDRRATIQHLHGSSNDLENLRAWCSRCNTRDVQSRMRPVTDPAKLKLARAFTRRYTSKRPTRACDDQRRWENAWRTIARRRFWGDAAVTGPLGLAVFRDPGRGTP